MNNKCFYCDSISNVIPHFKYQINKTTLELYGRYYLESMTNTVHACNECASRVERWTEIQFCDAMNINPASVSGKIIKKQLEERGCCQ